MIETKKTGLNREIEALKNIEHFGFLTTKSIADLTEGVEGDTALKSAKRVVKRLLEKKEILKRVSLEGINCFVLTKIGAERAAAHCFEKTAKTGVELATRFARRQEMIVSKLCEIKKNSESKTIILIGEIRLKRDRKKRFSGFDGVAWDFTSKKGNAIFAASSCHRDTINYIIELNLKHSSYLSKITTVSLDQKIADIVVKKLNKIKGDIERNRPPKL